MCTRTPRSTGSTASPSTSASGGSTCGRPTRSRCCASTSRPRRRRTSTVTWPRCRLPWESDAMALDAQLLEILACPEDKGPLLYFEAEDSLYNPRLKRRYAIRDDIPIMLIDEAEAVDDAEHERLMAKASAEGIKPTFDA